MTVDEKSNPFKVGDCVVFTPDERTIGWEWSEFDRARLRPGDSGVVTRVDKDVYLYLDDNRGGFHWECFRLASPDEKS